MSSFYVVVLPVYGRIGKATIWDYSHKRPEVQALHYVFDYMPESELFQTSPVYVATTILLESLQSNTFSGIEGASMNIEVSETFKKLNQDPKHLKEYSWLKIHGRPQVEDFGINSESRLVVSQRALDHLHRGGVREVLRYDAEKAPTPSEVEHDLFKAARKAVEDSLKRDTGQK
jgi:hypothetical protein